LYITRLYYTCITHGSHFHIQFLDRRGTMTNINRGAWAEVIWQARNMGREVIQKARFCGSFFRTTSGIFKCGRQFLIRIRDCAHPTSSPAPIGSESFNVFWARLRNRATVFFSDDFRFWRLPSKTLVNCSHTAPSRWALENGAFNSTTLLNQDSKVLSIFPFLFLDDDAQIFMNWDKLQPPIPRRVKNPLCAICHSKVADIFAITRTTAHPTANGKKTRIIWKASASIPGVRSDRQNCFGETILNQWSKKRHPSNRENMIRIFESFSHCLDPMDYFCSFVEHPKPNECIMEPWTSREGRGQTNWRS